MTPGAATEFPLHPADVDLCRSALARWRLVKHPGLSRPLSWTWREGIFTVESEASLGEPLADRLRAWRAVAGRREDLVELAIQIGASLAQVLDAVHSTGLSYGELPLEMVHFEGGRARIGRFGLGALQARLRGGPIDQRDDLYELGCLLYEMLSGRRPTSSPSGTSPVNHDSIEGIPAWLGRLLRELLAPDRRDRPPSALDVAVRLAVEGGVILDESYEGPHEEHLLPAPPMHPEVIDEVRGELVEALAAGRGVCRGILAEREGLGGGNVLRWVELAARRAGWRVIRLRATSRGRPAWSSAAGLIGWIRRVDPETEIGVWKDLGLDPVSERRRRVALLQRHVTAATRVEPLCLLVDDADRLDPLTAAAVEGVTAAPKGGALAVIALGSRRPALQALLGPEAHLDTLGERSMGEIVGLLEALAGGPIPGRVMDRIEAAAEGRPEEATQFLRAAIESGAIRRDARGRWTVGQAHPAAPSTAPWPAQRLAALSSRARSLAALLGVAAAPLPAEVLYLLSGLGRDDVDLALRQLLGRQVVEIDDDDLVTPRAWPVVAEAARRLAGQSTSEVRGALAQLATADLVSGWRPPAWWQAEQWRGAGLIDRAAEAQLRAARGLAAELDLEAALEAYARTAADLRTTQPEAAARVLVEGLERCAVPLDQPARVEGRLRELTPNAELRHRCVWLEAWAAWRRGHHRRAMTAARTLLDATLPPEQAARATILWSRIAGAQDPEGTRRFLEDEARRLADRIGPEAYLGLLDELARLCRDDGDLDAARAWLSQALDRGRSQGTAPSLLIELTKSLAQVEADAGRLDEARSRLQDAAELAAALGDPILSEDIAKLLTPETGREPDGEQPQAHRRRGRNHLPAPG